MAIKFYLTPDSCSTGIHILLGELELPFGIAINNTWTRPAVQRVPREEGYR